MEDRRLSEDSRLTFESYTLVLKHSIWEGGNEYLVDEPIAVRCMYDKTFGNPTNVINEMLEKMKYELLSRFAR